MTIFVRRSARGSRALAAAIALVMAGTACSDDTPSDPPFEPSLDIQLRESLEGWGVVVPIIDVPRQNPAMVELGRALFFDKELSGNRDVSCATCHDVGLAGGDGMSLAVGTGGIGTGRARLPGQRRQFVPRNAPSMLNQGLTFPYIFWDGRLAEFEFDGPPPPLGSTSGLPGFPAGLNNVLAKQAMLPVLNRVEMRGERGDRDRSGKPNELAEIPDTDAAAIWAAAMRRLLVLQDYVAKFSAAFPGTPTASLGFRHAANALAAFELDAFTRTNSPFDRFLARDSRAMSDEAKRGGILFFGKAQCAQCHSGPLLGGQQFANIGIPQLGPGVGSSVPLDIGRAEIFAGLSRGDSSFYSFAFRVPQLRNVELTAPYMHNGAYPTLETVVRHYTNADSALRSYDVTQVEPALRGSHRGDAATIDRIIRSLDFRIRQRIQLTPAEQREIVAFLKSLTDPSARNLGAIAPLAVPSGLPVRD